MNAKGERERGRNFIAADLGASNNTIGVVLGHNGKASLRILLCKVWIEQFVAVKSCGSFFSCQRTTCQQTLLSICLPIWVARGVSCWGSGFIIYLLNTTCWKDTRMEKKSAQNKLWPRRVCGNAVGQTMDWCVFDVVFGVSWAVFDGFGIFRGFGWICGRCSLPHRNVFTFQQLFLVLSKLRFNEYLYKDVSYKRFRDCSPKTDGTFEHTCIMLIWPGRGKG